MNSDKQESIGYSFFYSCHDGQNNKSETPPEVLTLGWTHSTWGRRHRDQPYLGAKWRQKAEIKWKPQRPFLWTSRWTEKKIRWRKTLFNNIRYFDITKSAFGNNRLFCARIWSRLASELKTKSPCHIKQKVSFISQVLYLLLQATIPLEILIPFKIPNWLKTQ